MNLKLPYFHNRFIKNKVDFYTTWEDIDIIQKTLNINNKDTVLTITSGGCNVLNFLLYNPKKIISIDFNKHQEYLMELKIESIKNLEYNEFLEIIGVKISDNAEKYYKNIRNFLNKKSREFWDNNIWAIKKGIIRVGEPDVKLFGKIFKFLVGEKKLIKFFNCKTIDEQREYFLNKIYRLPIKSLIKITRNNYYIKLNLLMLIFWDISNKGKIISEFFEYIQNHYYPSSYQERFKEVFTNVPIKYNYFASLMLFNNYIFESCYPPYLKKENYTIVKERIDRIQIKTTSLKDTLREMKDGCITKFNLSNIFDWINDDEFRKQLDEIVRVGTNKSRIFYLISRKDRFIPQNFKGMISDKNLEKTLILKDRSMMYSNFEIGEIHK